METAATPARPYEAGSRFAYHDDEFVILRIYDGQIYYDGPGVTEPHNGISVADFEERLREQVYVLAGPRRPRQPKPVATRYFEEVPEPEAAPLVFSAPTTNRIKPVGLAAAELALPVDFTFDETARYDAAPAAAFVTDEVSQHQLVPPPPPLGAGEDLLSDADLRKVRAYLAINQCETCSRLLTRVMGAYEYLRRQNTEAAAMLQAYLDHHTH